LISLVLNLHKELHQLLAGLGFCHGKKTVFFARRVEKTAKTAEKPAKTPKNNYCIPSFQYHIFSC